MRHKKPWSRRRKIAVAVIAMLIAGGAWVVHRLDWAGIQIAAAQGACAKLRAKGYNCQLAFGSKQITISAPGVDYDPAGDTSEDCDGGDPVLNIALHGWTMILRGYESRRELMRCKL